MFTGCLSIDIDTLDRALDPTTRHILGAIFYTDSRLSVSMKVNGKFKIFKWQLQCKYEVLTSKPIPLFKETADLHYILAVFLTYPSINIHKSL